MPNPIDEGTKTTDGTEQTLYTAGTDRVTQLFVNMDNSAATETIVIRTRTKILTGDTLDVTAAIVEEVTLTGVDGGLPGAIKVFQSEPFSGPYGVFYSIEKTAGTNRDYKWRVDEV